MTDHTLKPDGSCPDWQPGDRIVMPGAEGFDATCNRLIARQGWTKHPPNHPWTGNTTNPDPDTGATVIAVRQQPPGHSKYGILYPA